jgi:hypothetical protein
MMNLMLHLSRLAYVKMQWSPRPPYVADERVICIGGFLYLEDGDKLMRRTYLHRYMINIFSCKEGFLLGMLGRACAEHESSRHLNSDKYLAWKRSE